MSEKYYLIKDNEHPDGMRLTIRTTGKTIENLTGGNDLLKKFNCMINSRGDLVSENCLTFELTKQEADKNVQNYCSWIMLQGYVVIDAVKPSVVKGMDAFF